MDRNQGMQSDSNTPARSKMYVKPTMRSEQVFQVGFLLGPLGLCGGGTTQWSALCIS